MYERAYRSRTEAVGRSALVADAEESVVFFELWKNAIAGYDCFMFLLRDLYVL